MSVLLFSISGVVIMKMIRRTKARSSSGVTLISESVVGKCDWNSGASVTREWKAGNGKSQHDVPCFPLFLINALHRRKSETRAPCSTYLCSNSEASSAAKLSISTIIPRMLVTRKL